MVEWPTITPTSTERCELIASAELINGSGILNIDIFRVDELGYPYPTNIKNL